MIVVVSQKKRDHFLQLFCCQKKHTKLNLIFWLGKDSRLYPFFLRNTKKRKAILFFGSTSVQPFRSKQNTQQHWERFLKSWVSPNNTPQVLIIFSRKTNPWVLVLVNGTTHHFRSCPNILLRLPQCFRCRLSSGRCDRLL